MFSLSGLSRVNLNHMQNENFLISHSMIMQNQINQRYSNLSSYDHYYGYHTQIAYTVAERETPNPPFQFLGKYRYWLEFHQKSNLQISACTKNDVVLNVTSKLQVQEQSLSDHIVCDILTSIRLTQI